MYHKAYPKFNQYLINMFKLKGSDFILENGSFRITVSKNLALSEKKRTYIENQLTEPVIREKFELLYYFDGDVYLELTKNLLRFHGHGENVLDVDVTLKVNDKDTRSILNYIIDDDESDSSDGEEIEENTSLNVKDIDKEENDKMSIFKKVLYGRATA